MEKLPDWVGTLLSVGSLIGTLVTAVATFFLWRVTQVLARETTRMAETSSQPHVVATLDPNPWSMRHSDLNVNNTGNGTAYDISIDFDPPLENGESRKMKQIPLQRISVLKPGQKMTSYLSDYGPLEGKTYTVTIGWQRAANTAAREVNVYTLNMLHLENISRLGSDPLVQIADHVKKLQEDLKQAARGSTRIKVDAYLAGDRLHERRVSSRERRRFREARSQNLSETKSPEEEGNV